MELKARSLRSTLGIVAALALTTTTAAAASSGWVKWGSSISTPSGGVDIYLKAETILDTGVVVHTHAVQARNPGQSSLKRMPEGNLRTLVAAYKDGGFCFQSDWVVSQPAAASVSAGISGFCSDPPGQQSFYTGGLGGVWTGNNYRDFGFQASPILTH